VGQVKKKGKKLKNGGKKETMTEGGERKNQLLKTRKRET